MMLGVVTNILFHQMAFVFQLVWKHGLLYRVDSGYSDPV